MALAHVHRFTTDEFLALDGLPRRTELIDGVIYDMAPEGPLHPDTQAEVLQALMAALPGFKVWAGGSIQVTDDFCPIPDVAVYPAGFAPAEYPLATDVLLVVEVGISSAVTDRTLKAPRYAAGGVRELWLVDPGAGTLTLYRDPFNGRYEETVELSWPDGLQPVVERFARRLQG